MDDSVYTKVALHTGNHVVCQVTSLPAHSLGQCEDCGFFAPSSLILLCGHYLCEECYAECTQFTCKKDNTLTRKAQARRETCLYDQSLKKTILECPRCGSLKKYTKIAVPGTRIVVFRTNATSSLRNQRLHRGVILERHIRDKHPELSNQNSSWSPKGRTGIKTSKEKYHNFYQTPSECKLGPALGSDHEGKALQVKNEGRSVTNVERRENEIPPSITPTERSETCNYGRRTEPERSCGDSQSCAGILAGGMPSETYVPSAATAQKTGITCHTEHTVRPTDEVSPALQTTSQTATPTTFRVATEDNCEWSKQTLDALRKLQESAKELEEKLDLIEEPLEMIIQRLSCRS